MTGDRRQPPVTQTLHNLQDPSVVREEGGQANLVWSARDAAAPLLQCADLLPCLVWTTALAVFCATGEWRKQGSNTRGVDLAGVWKQVAKNRAHVTHCHQRVLELLGVSSDAMLWCAALLHGTNTGAMANMEMAALFVPVYAGVAYERIAARSACEHAGGLDTLLPSLLVHWASRLAAAKSTAAQLDAATLRHVVQGVHVAWTILRNRMVSLLHQPQ